MSLFAAELEEPKIGISGKGLTYLSVPVMTKPLVYPKVLQTAYASPKLHDDAVSQNSPCNPSTLNITNPKWSFPPTNWRLGPRNKSNTY